MRRPLAFLAVLLLAGCVTATRQRQSTTRTNLGTAYLREGDAAAAITVLREAVRKDPRNWKAWDRLALAYMAQGDAEQSEKAFRKGIRLEPEKAEINNNYGLMLMSQGRMDEAIARFNAARKDLTYRRPALVLNNLGRALMSQERHAEALEVLDKAIDRSPELCQAHLNRGLVLVRLDRLDGALASYEQVIELCGDNAPGAYLHAAELLLGKGDRVAACAYLGNVLRLSDPAGDIYDQADKVAALECP